MDESEPSRLSSTEADENIAGPAPTEVLATAQVELEVESAQGPTFILQPRIPTNEDDRDAPGSVGDEHLNDTQSANDGELRDGDEPVLAQSPLPPIDEEDSAGGGSGNNEPESDRDYDGDHGGEREGESEPLTDKPQYLYADNAGAEVAVARQLLSSAGPESDGGPAAEDDLPDQVRSDVRPRTEQELEVLQGESYAAEQARANKLQREVNYTANVTTEHPQPSQGVQADVDQTEAEAVRAAAEADSAPDTAATEARRAQAREAGVEKTTPLNAAETSSRATAHASPTTVQATQSPPTAQAAQGTTTVVVTLEPMGCRTSLTLPVHRFHSESNGYRNVAPSEAGADHDDNNWVIIAKDLFEAIGRHLAIHPQSFHLFRNGERIRFMSTLFLDRDMTNAESATSAEPLWVSVVFPPDETGTLGAGQPQDPQQDNGAASSSSSIPAHLASLDPNDVLVRCVYVRRVKPFIAPSTLVESRQRFGLTFDQAIHAANENAGAQADPSLMAAVSVVQSAGGATKPFIGGFRDVRDHSRVLHHASTQLFMKDLNYSPFPQVATAVTDKQSRQTQTWGISRSCQTHRECCVQTPVTGVVLDTSRDLVVKARPYFSAADLLRLRTQKVIILQKLYRQWKARAIRRELEDAEAEKQHRAEARQRAEEAAQLARDELERLRRSDPRSANDFERLKAELEAWRAQESAYVQADPGLSNEEKRSALLAITKQELKLLQELERHRRQAMVEGKDRQFDRTMEKMASAKLWGQVEVTTRESERARELMELYRDLVQPSRRDDSSAAGSTAGGARLASSTSARATASGGEGGAGGGVVSEDTAAPRDRTSARLDALLHVKWTVKEFDSELTRELCQLIDREADLLHRGRREASMAGLRQRIALLFKRFIEDPQHNPGMAEYTRSAVGRLKARTLYGTVYNDDGSAVPGTTLVKPAATKD